MERYLVQAQRLVAGTSAHVLYTGDIFDKWNSPPELINFALKHLPRGFAVPGQHDLPLHSFGEIKKSAFWTLVEAGVLELVRAGQPLEVATTGKGPHLRLHGFPFGESVTPCTSSNGLCLEIALIHAMVWTRDTGFQGAPPSGRLKQWLPRLKGYDLALFGDNHKGFLKRHDWTEYEFMYVHNGGGFIRRRTDEANYQPCVGLIYGDGRLERVPLDCSEDKLLAKEEVGEWEGSVSVAEILEKLAELGEASADFYEAVKLLAAEEGVSPGVRALLERLLGRG